MINGDLIKINNNRIMNIVSYKVGRNKLWKESDRNMNGDLRATLIGIFPKITLNIGVCNEEELQRLILLFDSDFFTVEYYDARIKGMKTGLYYASDYEPELLSKKRGLYKSFSVSLVPIKKVSY